MTIESIVAVLGPVDAAVAHGQVPAPRDSRSAVPQAACARSPSHQSRVSSRPESEWTLAWQGTDNADGIVGTDDGGLLFAQEQPNRVSKLDPNDKRVGVRREHPRRRVGGVRRSRPPRGGAADMHRSRAVSGQCPEPPAIGVIYPER